MADVIANMLFVADLIATYCGCCYTTCVYFIMSLNYVLADVIAMMWKMLNHIWFFFLCIYFGRCCCHGGRWNGHPRWVMIGRCYCHSGWCCYHCQLFQFKFWDVQQNFIPYVWQMELAHILVKGWIISPDVNGFFYCSEEGFDLPLPIYWNLLQKNIKCGLTSSTSWQ